jgi:hypothetical protein
LSRKENIEELVMITSSSIQSLIAGGTNASEVMRHWNYLVDRFSTLNEALYYLDEQEPMGVETKQKYIESTEMYKIITELLLMELDKLARNNDILK